MVIFHAGSKSKTLELPYGGAGGVVVAHDQLRLSEMLPPGLRPCPCPLRRSWVWRWSRDGGREHVWHCLPQELEFHSLKMYPPGKDHISPLKVAGKMVDSSSNRWDMDSFPGEYFSALRDHGLTALGRSLLMNTADPLPCLLVRYGAFSLRKDIIRHIQISNSKCVVNMHDRFLCKTHSSTTLLSLLGTWSRSCRHVSKSFAFQASAGISSSCYFGGPGYEGCKSATWPATSGFFCSKLHIVHMCLLAIEWR